MQAYSFFGQNIYFLIFRTGKSEVSEVPTRCPEQCASIFVFRSNKFFLISRFLEVSQVKERCKRCQRDDLKSMQVFSFFVPKDYSSIIPFLEVAQVKSRCQQ